MKESFQTFDYGVRRRNFVRQKGGCLHACMRNGSRAAVPSGIVWKRTPDGQLFCSRFCSCPKLPGFAGLNTTLQVRRISLKQKLLKKSNFECMPQNRLGSSGPVFRRIFRFNILAVPLVEL
jgi:hypothetical protein